MLSLSWFHFKDSNFISWLSKYASIQVFMIMTIINYRIAIIVIEFELSSDLIWTKIVLNDGIVNKGKCNKWTFVGGSCWLGTAFKVVSQVVLWRTWRVCFHEWVIFIINVKAACLRRPSDKILVGKHVDLTNFFSIKVENILTQFESSSSLYIMIWNNCNLVLIIWQNNANKVFFSLKIISHEEMRCLFTVLAVNDQEKNSQYQKANG